MPRRISLWVLAAVLAVPARGEEPLAKVPRATGLTDGQKAVSYTHLTLPTILLV